MIIRLLLATLLISSAVFSVYYGYQEYITTDISELNANASEYDGQIVYIKGVVEKNISILGFGGFILGDGMETVLVTSGNGVPKNNTTVLIKGEFRKAVSFNGFEYNIIYQK